MRRALPLTLAYGLVLASLYVLKPARNALFLSQQGVDQLPYVLLLVALVGGVFALVYGRLTQSLAVEKLVPRTFWALAAMLGGFRFALEGEPPSWVLYAFYVWVALYGLLTTSLVWLLANGVFTSREARKVFGLIGSGGIAGAIVGGLFTGRIAEEVGTENLLLVCMGLLALCVGLFRMLPSTEDAPAARRSEEAPPSSGLGAVASSPLLRNLALATGLIAAVAVVVDVQFNELVDRTFPEQDAKTAFFGTFFAALSAFSFVFQILFTSRILQVFGVGPALTILPAAMGLGSLGFLMVPGLIAGMAAKGADGGFRHSVHKAASEVLFLPVPNEVKKQAKLFLDTTVDTTATGLGALAVLLLTEQLGVPYQHLSVLSVSLMVLVLFVMRRLRAAYVDAFRTALESRRIDLGELRTSLAEAGAIELLRPALRSERPRQVVYALDLLADAAPTGLRSEADRLLEHPHVEVRRRALELRSRLGPMATERLEALAQDPDPSIRSAALAHLADQDPDMGRARIEASLEDRERCSVGLGALSVLPPSTARGWLEPARVEGWVADAPGPELRVALAGTLGYLGDPALDGALSKLLATGEPAVRRAAIEGIGGGRNRAWLPWLAEQLERRQERSAVRDALVAFGAASVPFVAARLEDRRDPAVRRALPRVLRRIPTQSSVEVLTAHLLDEDPGVARATRRASTQLRAQFDTLRFDRRHVQRALEACARRSAATERALADLEPERMEKAPAGKLLLRALREARADEREVMLDLLALRHDPGDIERARRGLSEDAPAQVRASALELLENVLDGRARDFALAVLDHERAHATAVGAPRRQLRGALKDLCSHPSRWLSSCAGHLLEHA